MSDEYSAMKLSMDYSLRMNLLALMFILVKNQEMLKPQEQPMPVLHVPLHWNLALLSSVLVL
jgi:hypothetical protein